MAYCFTSSVKFQGQFLIADGIKGRGYPMGGRLRGRSRAPPLRGGGRFSCSKGNVARANNVRPYVAVQNQGSVIPTTEIPHSIQYNGSVNDRY